LRRVIPVASVIGYAEAVSLKARLEPPYQTKTSLPGRAEVIPVVSDEVHRLRERLLIAVGGVKPSAS
jgi:hypothetical protein